MKIHEYQAKGILEEYDIPVPRGQVAESPEEAEHVASSLGGRVAVKAQVHVGGRGKAGGIKVAANPQEAADHARSILGMRIKGLPVRKVLVEEAISIQKEYYLGLAVDRGRKQIVLMASPSGGIDIEEVARSSPDLLLKLPLQQLMGLLDYQVREVVEFLALEGEARKEAAGIVKNLCRAFFSSDAQLAEINPLVLTGDRKLLAADAKMDIDENALFRQKALAAFREAAEDDPIEQEAHKRRLPYVHLDGDIGIIGNGAGLVMTTLDMVAREGGRPANFLDVGGGANWELVRDALDLILMEKKVKGILINIFGGITRCDEVAKGIIEASAHLKIQVPMVIRLSGTLEEEGRRLLESPGAGSVQFTAAPSMEEAAGKIAELVRSR